MHPLIFLDIDGCLNNHQFHDLAQSNTIDRRCVDVLNAVLVKTDARIVLSSAWRYLIHREELDVEGFDWLLRSHGVVARRLIGYTRLDTMQYDHRGKEWPVADERGQQIWDWIRKRHSPGQQPPYVVIDDMDLGISTAGHPFVQTLGNVGLTEVDGAKAIELLEGQRR